MPASPLAAERPALHGGEAEPQRVELDEAFRVALVVDLVGLESDVIEGIEAGRRLAPDHVHGALVQLELQEEIPPELYRAVAEILAFAYRLNRNMNKT